MRCIFCKRNSDSSSSVEHILPESLGNVDYILPRGWVCDACNNYVSREIEKPFLESHYCRYSRFHMCVPSKKGRVPTALGMHRESGTKVELTFTERDGLSVGAAEGEDELQWVRAMKCGDRGNLYVPAPQMPDIDYTTSRFVAKVGFEVLAGKFSENPAWNDELVDKPELNGLREYVRMGTPKNVWPINVRRIYPQEFVFSDSCQVLHEWDILITNNSEYYAVIAIFGVEYVINLGGREIVGFTDWLEANNFRSPLYPSTD